MSARDRIWESWWLSGGRDELAELLWREWDPIYRGMAGSPPPDEYIDQADQIGAMLRGGCTEEALAGWLQNMEHAMHLLPDDADLLLDHQVAQAILTWYAASAPTGA